MARRLYNGMLMTKIKGGVLINAGNKWSISSPKKFLEDSGEHLKRASVEDMYFLWYHMEVDYEGTSN